ECRRRLRPDLLHRLDPLSHQLEAGCKRSAVIGHLLLVPTSANAENEPTRGKLVDRRYLLGGVNWITLKDKADPRSKLNGFRHRGGSGKRDERIVAIVIVLRQLSAAGPRRFATGGNVTVLRQPQRLVTSRLRHPGKVVRLNRVIRRKHCKPDMHVQRSSVSAPSHSTALDGHTHQG